MGTVRRIDDNRGVAVRRYQHGESVRSIATSLGRSRWWVYKWLARAATGGPAWATDRSRRPHASPHALPADVVEAVCLVRLELYNAGLLCGSQNIRWRLEDLAVTPLPSVRTITRILAREELTHRRTSRYAPKGTPYPALPAEWPNQVHQADYVGPCYLQGPVRFWSLHAVDVATVCGAPSNPSPPGPAKPRWMPSGRPGTAWGSRPMCKRTTSWSFTAVPPILGAWDSSSACVWGRASSRGSSRSASRGGTASWSGSIRTSGPSSWPGSRSPTSPGCGRPAWPSRRDTTAGTGIPDSTGRRRAQLWTPSNTPSASRRRRPRRPSRRQSPRPSGTTWSDSSGATGASMS